MDCVFSLNLNIINWNIYFLIVLCFPRKNTNFIFFNIITGYEITYLILAKDLPLCSSALFSVLTLLRANTSKLEYTVVSLALIEILNIGSPMIEPWGTLVVMSMVCDKYLFGILHNYCVLLIQTRRKQIL